MASDTIDRLTSGSRLVDPGLREWEATDAPGFLIKPIFRDERTGDSSMLMRIEPGAFFPAHAHGQLEEILVLEGDFYDEEHSYAPGQYCQRAVGASHTAGSRGGCVVFVVYRN